MKYAAHSLLGLVALGQLSHSTMAKLSAPSESLASASSSPSSSSLTRALKSLENIFDQSPTSTSFMSAFLVTTKSTQMKVTAGTLSKLETDIMEAYNSMASLNAFEITSVRIAPKQGASSMAEDTHSPIFEYSYVIELKGEYSSSWCTHLHAAGSRGDGDMLSAPGLFRKEDGLDDLTFYMRHFVSGGMCHTSTFTSAEFITSLMEDYGSKLPLEEITQVTYSQQCTAQPSTVAATPAATFGAVAAASAATGPSPAEDREVRGRMRVELVGADDDIVQTKTFQEKVRHALMAAYNEKNELNPHLCDPKQRQLLTIDLDSGSGGNSENNSKNSASKSKSNSDGNGSRRLDGDPTPSLAPTRAPTIAPIPSPSFAPITFADSDDVEFCSNNYCHWSYSWIGHCITCGTYFYFGNDVRRLSEQGADAVRFNALFETFLSETDGATASDGAEDIPEDTCFCPVNDSDADATGSRSAADPSVTMGAPGKEEVLELVNEMLGEDASIVLIAEQVDVPCSDEPVTEFKASLSIDFVADDASALEECFGSVYNTLQESTTCDREFHLVRSATVVTDGAASGAGVTTLLVDAQCQGCDPEGDLIMPLASHPQRKLVARSIERRRKWTSQAQRKMMEEQCVCDIEMLASNHVPTMENFLAGLESCVASKRR